MSRRSHAALSLIAASAMAVGIMVYLRDRAAGTAYLLPDAMFFEAGGSPMFGALGYVLPSFLHVYAFAILTGICAGDSRRSAAAASICWLLIDGVLELCQVSQLASIIGDLLPAWFRAVPILENIGPYFMQGTFDPNDLLALLAGAGAAFITLRFAGRRHELQR